MRSHSPLAAFLVAFCLLAGLAGGAAAQDLKPVPTTAEHGFTIQMPGVPSPQFQAVKIPQGEVQTGSWSLDSGDGIYSVSFADYPEEMVTKRGADQMLEDAVLGLSNQFKGTLDTWEPETLEGNPGWRYTVVSEMGRVQARNYLVGRRLYTLVVIGRSAQAPTQTDAFFASFRLTR